MVDHAHEYMSSWLVSACAGVGVRVRDADRVRDEG